MGVNTILGSSDYMEFLRGKRATFMLSLSTTQTCQIEGITQAGIPGLIHLTPTLDSEFVCTGEVRCLDDVAKTPTGIPTPALMTRAVHLLKPFSHIEILDLGMTVKPKLEYFKVHEFGLQPSLSVDTKDMGANIDAMALFEKAVEFGKNYQCQDDYIILAESVPAGTTTAQTLAKALGYEVESKFSSSFKKAPTSIKQAVMDKAMQNVQPNEELFSAIGKVADNMQIFNAGFILGASANETKIVLAGGTQMAAVLLLVNSIVKYMGGKLESKNLALCTTKWVEKDSNSDIKALLEMLEFDINAYSANFDFSLSSHPALKLYDQGEAKEGVGAGAALAYGMINGLSQEQIIKKVESFLG